MNFTGITCIWADSLSDIRKDFTTEFNRMMEEGELNEGIHVFYFTRYKDYKVYTEQITAHIYADTVIFYLYSGSMVFDLDDSMQVTNGDIVPKNHLVLAALNENEKSDTLEYIDWVCTPQGHVFEAYTLKYNKPMLRAYEIFDNDDYYLSGLDIRVDELIDTSLMYLADKIEKWEEDVNTSIATDQASVNIEDNPFANKFYDRAEGYQMREDKIRIGDKQV